MTSRSGITASSQAEQEKSSLILNMTQTRHMKQQEMKEQFQQVSEPPTQLSLFHSQSHPKLKEAEARVQELDDQRHVRMYLQ